MDISHFGKVNSPHCCFVRFIAAISCKDSRIKGILAVKRCTNANNNRHPSTRIFKVRCFNNTFAAIVLIKVFKLVEDDSTAFPVGGEVELAGASLGASLDMVEEAAFGADT